VLLVGLTTPGAAQVPEGAPTSAGADSELERKARALEGRIVAPCCKNQTADVHNSDVTRALHTEIVGRLRAGESAASIEASLVERYGPEILAVPKDNPLPLVALLSMLAVVLAGMSIFALGARWKRREQRASADGAEAGTAQTGDDAYDERLRRELEALD
jgi:cytochrome c-type biogenesis protein CcmH